MLARPIVTIGSLVLRQPALLVLTYHRVLPEADPLLRGEPDAAVFASQMAYLRRNLTPLALTEAVDRLRAGELPPRAVAVTFDDGYANNATCALPILQRYGIPATVFVATGLLDGGLMFNDALLELARRAKGPALDLGRLGLGDVPIRTDPERRTAFEALVRQVKYLPPAERLPLAREIADREGVALPTDLMLSAAQVRALATAGIEIGGHTVTHPILAALDAAAARREIAGSFERLKEITGTPPRAFAYPNGIPGRDFRPEHCAMVREAGYSYALATTRGCATAADDFFALPRAVLWAATPWRLTRNLLSIYRDEIGRKPWRP